MKFKKTTHATRTTRTQQTQKMMFSSKD